MGEDRQKLTSCGCRSEELDMCDIKNEILRELIKERSTFLIMGRCWMRLGKKKNYKINYMMNLKQYVEELNKQYKTE